MPRSRLGNRSESQAGKHYPFGQESSITSWPILDFRATLATANEATKRYENAQRHFARLVLFLAGYRSKIR